MTLTRIASTAALLAFLAVPAPLSSAWAQQDKSASADKAPNTDKSELYQQLNLFGDVLERIRRDYVEPVDEKTLMENAINGMLSSLDRKSTRLNSSHVSESRMPSSA